MPKDRRAALEKAGAALASRYMASGEEALALDVSGGRLDAAEVAAVLTGLRLRTWRYDVYRTKLKDEQKVTLAEAVVIGAPEGTAAAWEVEQAVAAGVELTRELVAEPANVIYPESFVERVQRAAGGHRGGNRRARRKADARTRHGGAARRLAGLGARCRGCCASSGWAAKAVRRRPCSSARA